MLIDVCYSVFLKEDAYSQLIIKQEKLSKRFSVILTDKSK